MLLVFPVALAAAPPPIINGDAADEARYPMTGGLLIDADWALGGTTYELEGLMCSGTLIAPDVVLVAAHCLDPEVITLGQGELTSVEFLWSRQADLTAWDRNAPVAGWPADAVVAWDTVMHEAYDGATLTFGIGVQFDVGLVFLREPILDVTPAVLVTEAESEQIVPGAAVEVVGWGQQVSMPQGVSPPAGTFGVKMWGQSTIGEVGTAEFVVGASPEAVRKCYGDSGGPTFMKFDTTSPSIPRQIGVTSHLYDDTYCDSRGAVDTRLDVYLDWIDVEMRSRCDSGGRRWCDEPGILPVPSEVAAETADGAADDNIEAVVATCAAVGPPVATSAAPIMLLALLRRRPPPRVSPPPRLRE